MSKITKFFDVYGMKCHSCELSVEREINKLDGISNVSADHVNSMVIVTYDDDFCDDNKIKMNPIEEIELLREECISSEENVIVSENNSFKIKTSEKMLEIDVTFDILNSDSKELGLKINGSDEEELVLKYNTDASQLTIDCSKYGKEQDYNTSLLYRAYNICRNPCNHDFPLQIRI